ncbi:FAD:protein FMN transferase [Lentisphaera profundi]|uniref:FAD:protein FMN transferase n=1 Tax=Lentisphaera profundi TaxID=1658616 RepID=A0ABY7VTV5_9BACT|nr:FAD:protein FMN transferase [Lentisphaera profundi]WDE97640.1 FAD:protein FMN transferase [Lentisphaera profundi]
MRKTILLLLLVFLSSPLFSQDLKSYSFTEKIMACDFRILIYAHNSNHAEDSANKAFAKISAINLICSDYITQSEVSQLSTSHNTWTSLSDDLWRILKYSQDLSKESKGAFDITCGPLTVQWRKARYQNKLPDPNAITRLLKRCGYQKLELNQDHQSARLNTPFMKIDLGAIAKGYAADQAMLTLQKNGIKHAMIDASGDLLMSAHPTAKWKVYLKNGSDHQSKNYIEIKEGAVATSGSSIQNLSSDKKLYSHIIDPRTGMAITHNNQVTVISTSAIEADALASTLSVLPAAQGLKLLQNKLNCSALIHNHDSIKKSKNFPTLY